MIEQGAFDAWGLRTPPAWAQRALRKGIIDESRFQALIRVASEDPAVARRIASPPGKLLLQAPAHPILHALAGVGPLPADPGSNGPAGADGDPPTPVSP